MSQRHPQLPQGYNASPVPKLCEWCSGPLSGNQIVACCPNHRLLRWQWLHGVSFRADGNVLRPPEGSPLLHGHPEPGLAVQTAEDPSQGSRVSNGGLQVSAMRMYQELQKDPPYLTAQCARRVVARALSERQRDRFLEKVAA